MNPVPVPVTIIEGRAFVFNAKDYMRLRVEHRIVGSLVGCAVACPRNSNVNGLPAILSPFELHLLLEHQLIRLVDQRHLTEPPNSTEAHAYQIFLKDSIAGQKEQQRAAKVEESRKVLPRILEGKRKKMLRSGMADSEIQLDAEQVLLEIHAGCVFNADNALIEIPTQYVRFGDAEHTASERLSKNSTSDSTSSLDNPSLRASLKYRVFKDLWQRGKYVTNGDSFGGDFLVYPGDPMYFHASHIVHCCTGATDKMITVPATSLVAAGRMAVLVNKLCVFVWLDATNDGLVYQSMEWTGNSRSGVGE